MKDYNNISEELHERIISVAYGDAGIIDKIKIYYKSLRNSEVKIILDEYRATAREVHSIKEETYTGKLPGAKVNSTNVFISSIDLFFRRPILSSAFAMIIVGCIAGYLLFENSTKYNGYSKEEITLAEMQAKESFAIIAEIFNRTSTNMKEKILNKQLNDPIKKSFNIFNNYLIGG